jgi:hypothetical protein
MLIDFQYYGYETLFRSLGLGTSFHFLANHTTGSPYVYGFDFLNVIQYLLTQKNVYH